MVNGLGSNDDTKNIYSKLQFTIYKNSILKKSVDILDTESLLKKINEYGINIFDENKTAYEQLLEIKGI